VLAMDGAGDLIVAFTFADGFIAQRYNVANESLGPQILINTNGTGAEFPSVTMDNAGDFLIAWVGPTHFVQRYNAAGAAVDLIQITSDANDFFPSVAMDDAGNFMVAGVTRTRPFPSHPTPSGTTRPTNRHR